MDEAVPARPKKELTAPAPIYSTEHTFQHSWEAVTSAWLLKFPDPSLKQVRSVETVARVVNEADRTVQLRRLFLCEFKIPRLVNRFFGEVAHVVCVEEAHWDMNERSLVIHGRNETFQEFLRIDEVCTYTAVDKDKTLYTQSATVMYRKGVLSGLFMPVAREICAVICNMNAHKGTEAMVKRVQREAGEIPNHKPSDLVDQSRIGIADDIMSISKLFGGLAVAAGVGAAYWAQRRCREEE